jgi:hypothetical protein
MGATTQHTGRMRSHVEFRSDAFARGVDEDDEVNPGRYGKSVASWVKAELTERGVAMGPLVAEDWGWRVRVLDSPFPTWIGCGSHEEHDDGWLCFIDPHRPTIRRGLRTVDATEVIERVALALDAALRAHPGVRALRWWSDEEVRPG